MILVILRGASGVDAGIISGTHPPLLGEDGLIFVLVHGRDDGVQRRLPEHVHVHVEPAQFVNGRQTEDVGAHDRRDDVVRIREDRAGVVLGDEGARLGVGIVNQFVVRIGRLQGRLVREPVRTIDRGLLGGLDDGPGNGLGICHRHGRHGR